MSVVTAANYTLPPVVASAEAALATAVAPSPDGLAIPGPPRPSAPALTGAATSGVAPTLPSTASTAATTRSTTTTTPRVAPAVLTIASIGLSTPLVELGLQRDGSLEVPSDFRVAGWWTGGAAPGDIGPAVIAGHVDSYVGPGVFARLASLAVGSVVDVTRVDGAHRLFRVTRVARYPKAAFPSAEVYGATTTPELRLITCGGRFDAKARSYADNVVVYATAAES